MKNAALLTGQPDPVIQETHEETDLTTEARLNNFLQGIEQRAFITARLATQHEDEALDIVQDAMYKLVEKYAYRSETEWGALFHTILHSRINDWHRRQKVRNRWRVLFLAGEEETDTNFHLEERVRQSQFLEPEPQFIQDELSALVQTAVSQLPLRQQQALLLRAWEGYDIAETAEIMQCSPGSVKTHYSRAIHSLREKLGDY